MRVPPAILGPDETWEAPASAVKPSHVLYLSREDFFDAVAECPEFAEAMIRSLAIGVMELSRRVEDLERRLGLGESDRVPEIGRSTRIMPLAGGKWSTARGEQDASP